MNLAEDTAWVFAKSYLRCSISNFSDPADGIIYTDPVLRHAVTSLTKRIFRLIFKYVTWHSPPKFRQTLHSVLFESMFLCLNSYFFL